MLLAPIPHACRHYPTVIAPVVDGSMEISASGEVLRVHPIRHDRSREHGAFANAGGRPSRINAA